MFHYLVQTRGAGNKVELRQQQKEMPREAPEAWGGGAENGPGRGHAGWSVWVLIPVNLEQVA